MSNNNRASLLAGLRTGGVRSSSNTIPLTAAPNVTTFHQSDYPMTAAIGGSFHPMQAQQQAQAQAQAQVFHMQMMQMEIMRLQAAHQAQQVQQYQAEINRQQQQKVDWRTSSTHEPATAGPATTSFPRSRPSQVEQLKAQLHIKSPSEDQVPQTAALGGKFGGRLNPHASSFRFGGAEEADDSKANPAVVSPAVIPSAAGFTTVISGGTALGVTNVPTVSTTIAPIPAYNGTSIAPSKSDLAVNWRSGSVNKSVLNGNRAISVNVKISPPKGPQALPGLLSPITPLTATKSRPQPLNFSMAVSKPLPVVIDTSESESVEEHDDSSSSSNKSDSSPTTPRSSSSRGSGNENAPLTTREEASKRLYEGLGLGRAPPQTAQVFSNGFASGNFGAHSNGIQTSVGTNFPARVFSQPMRQPRGPPSGADELGPKNFATRIRRQAIGGLGAMLEARVSSRREIEAC